MKYLSLLAPIALWIACYFVWMYSGQFVVSFLDEKGYWWVLTDVIIVVITLLGFIWVWAIDKITD